MEHSYKTLGREVSEGSYREKGSKFLAFAYHIESEKDIKDRLDMLKKQYHDARHHCYAWILGETASKVRANDDGEPPGSAGKPILTQIRLFELTNVLLVVVRYFGGALLGTSGLIRAYKNAARDALDRANIRTIIRTRPFSIHFEYARMNDVMRVLKELQIKPHIQSNDLICELRLNVPLDQVHILQERFKSLPEVILKRL